MELWSGWCRAGVGLGRVGGEVGRWCVAQQVGCVEEMRLVARLQLVDEATAVWREEYAAYTSHHLATESLCRSLWIHGIYKASRVDLDLGHIDSAYADSHRHLHVKKERGVYAGNRWERVLGSEGWVVLVRGG